MRYLVLLVFLLSSSIAYGQSPPIETIPPGEDVITPLHKGDAAPYSGQLFDIDTSIRWGNWLQQYKYRLEWDVTKVEKTCKVQENYYKDLLQIEKDRAKKVEVDLTDRLKKAEEERIQAEDTPWYNTTEFGVVLGVVSTSLIFGIAVAAIGTTTSN